MQDDRSADAETSHRGQREELSRLGVQVQEVSEQSEQGEDNSHEIEPDWRMDGSSRFTITHPQLQQHRGGPDRSNHHDCKGTVECAAIGEDHNQGQQTAEQSGGQYCPAAALRLRLVQGQGLLSLQW